MENICKIVKEKLTDYWELLVPSKHRKTVENLGCGVSPKAAGEFVCVRFYDKDRALWAFGNLKWYIPSLELEPEPTKPPSVKIIEVQ